MNRTLLLAVALLVAIALVLAGCGSDAAPLMDHDDTPAAAASTPKLNKNQTPAGVERAVYRGFATVRWRDYNVLYATVSP